jgi:hypothetical protein
MTLPDELKFLGKLRFWTMVAAAIMAYLEMKGWIGKEEAIFVGGLSAAFWATQTIDRFGEKLGMTEVEAKQEIVEEKKEEKK